MSRAQNTETFGTALEAFKGIGPGFDVCRLILAIGVMLTHSLQQAHVPQDAADPGRRFNEPSMTNP